MAILLLSLFCNFVGLFVKARQLITGGSFGPVAIKAMTQAFDEAWEQIASHFDGDPMIRDCARQSLADAVLTAAADNISDVQALRDASLRFMASKNNSMRYTISPPSARHRGRRPPD